MKLLLLLLVTSCVCTGVLCRRSPKKGRDDLPTMTDEARLYNTLTRSYDRWNPHRAIRPVYNTSETMHISFGLAMVRFTYDDTTNTAVIHSLERYLWKDQSLQWDPEDYGGVSLIRIPISQLWKPDIVLYNSYEPSVSLDEETLAVVSSDGRVLYIPRVNHKVYCDTYDDTVYCQLKFGSWTYDGFKIDLDFYDGLEEVDISDYVLSNSYNLVKHPAVKNVKYYPCCVEPYPDLTFKLEFKKLSTWWNGKK